MIPSGLQRDSSQKSGTAPKVLWKRKIIHMDMDAFFAAVEQRDHPEYRGKPLVVGGNPQGRGVVSTASYEARKFGIRSAMSAAEARRLCPEAIFVRPQFEKYTAVSRLVMGIFHQHTELVEPVSIDEAYLDVTNHRFGIQDPEMIAKIIKQSIHAATLLTASAGVAPNFFLAKMASEFKKPDGLTVVTEAGAWNFLKGLSVRKIPGIGPKTEEELRKLGIIKIEDLERAGSDFLVRHLGKFGRVLYERSQGQDDREVEPHAEVKQMSTEETFEKDTLDLVFLKMKIRKFIREILESLKQEGKLGRTLVLKVKYHDFEVITRSQTFSDWIQDPDDLYESACRLLQNRTLAGKKAIRLLGIGISGLGSKATALHSMPVQGELFPAQGVP